MSELVPFTVILEVAAKRPSKDAAPRKRRGPSPPSRLAALAPQGARGWARQRYERRRIRSDNAKKSEKISRERPHTPKRLTPEQESAQRKAAFAAIRALFCQVTQPWHSCQRGYCRRHHCCIAEAGPGACLGRHWPLLTPAEQKAAHIEVIDGGPRRRAAADAARNGACAAFRRRISSTAER